MIYIAGLILAVSVFDRNQLLACSISIGMVCQMGQGFYCIHLLEIATAKQLPDFRFVLDRSIDFQLGIGNEFIVLLLCEGSD